MLLRVDFNKEIFQLLYHTIYQRVLKFGISQNHTLDQIKSRFIALVSGDERVYLLVKLEEIKVIGHCLFILQSSTACASIEQIESNDKEFMKECLDYIETIPNITQILVVIDENKYKNFRKKYEFKVEKVILTRAIKHE